MQRSLRAALAVIGAASLGLAPSAYAQGGPSPTPAAANTLPLKTARTHTFTTSKGTWISLDVSPDGQTLVFDMLGDLYTMPIGGGKATALTTGLPYDAQPRFSPDGKRIVFVSDRSGGDNLWMMTLDKKDTVQLTKGNDNLYLSPTFTPDGKYVVASKSGGPLGGSAKLWMYHVDGGNGVPLLTTAPPTLKTVGAAFGKQSRYIWYAARTGDWQYNAVSPQYQLYVYDRENGKTSQMSTRFGSAFRPALSPDGKYLVYATRFETKTGLRIRDLDTQAEEWLAYPVQRDETESRAPLDAYPGYAFTPDSKAVVVSYGGEIWRVPVDKSTAKKIPFVAEVKLEIGPEVKFANRVDTTSQFTSHQVRDIAPSPDGTKLAFSALDRVYVMDLPSGKPTRVSANEIGEYGPVWSPDSKSIAWVTWNDQAGGQIMRATWQGRATAPTVTQLSKNSGLYSDLAWSPAGDRIVATRAAAREMQEAGAAFFGPAAADFVWVPATGGAATLIMPAAGLGNAHFTTNPDRIYAYGRRDGLVSFRWDGTDLKSHLKVTGPMPPQASVAGASMTLDAGIEHEESKRMMGGRASRLVFGDDDPSEPNPPPQAPAAALVMMAPKGDQALAMVGMNIYTVTVPQVGSAPATVSVANPAAAAVPVRKLNEIGGEFPTWSGDGRKVMWSLANAVWTYDLDRAKVVEDSLKADARVKAAARRDSAGAPGAAPRAATDSAKSDTTKKDKPGYKPVEQRIVVAATRDKPRGTVVLRGGRAITMKGKEIIDNADVVVQDNRITAVGARGTVQVPAGAKIIDVTGKTVMPGFVDTHYHPQWLTPNIHTNQVWQYLATLAYGTTTTRDPQTSSTDFLSYGDRVETGEVVGPRIYTTGPGVFSDEQIKDLDHARTILKRYAQYYDTKTLKMYMTGNRQQREWVIMAAKELGLMPTTEGGLDFKLDITHGLDGYPGVEHTLPITPKFDDVFEWYKGTQLTNSPTLIVEYGGPFGEGWFYQSEDLLHDAKLKHFTHPVDFDTKVRRRGVGNSPGPAGFAVKEEYAMWQHAQDVAKTVAAGGRIGVGSHGQLQGLGMHWEIWLLQSGGLSQHDALRSATIVGAEAIGMGQDLGSLEPGKLADVIVLDKDPLVDIRNTNTVALVMKNGRVYDANTLDEVYPRQRKLAVQQWMGGTPSVGAGIR
ncbi:MAG TPA: amidohydrolase family protein [Gemmatimonadaceae bacterium]|nr:amidohydrolase family protein [Gemmatimonadaceae bacterium]